MARLATRLKIRTALGGKTALSDALDEGGATGPYPAPAGYRWDYATENGVRVPEDGQYAVELKRIA